MKQERHRVTKQDVVLLSLIQNYLVVKKSEIMFLVQQKREIFGRKIVWDGGGGP